MEKLFFILTIITLSSCHLDRVDPISNEKPKASFNYPSETLWVGCPIPFDNTSENASSYFWDFGDGQTSAQENPEHTFQSGGNFTVTLKATNAEGQDSIVRTIMMKPQFQRAYTQGSTSYNVIATTDGGYLISGSGFVSGILKIVLLKTDECGDISWSYTDDGFDELNYGLALTEHSEGYVVGGYARRGDATESQALFIKVAFDGTVMVRKTFGKPDAWEDAQAITKTPGGGFVLAGSHKEDGSTDRQILVIELDKDGNQIGSDYKFGGTQSEEAKSIIKTSDGYLIAGYTTSFGNGNADAFVLTLNDFFLEVDDMSFGGPENDYAYSVIESGDGGYVLAGSTQSSGAGMSDVYIVKLGANLTKIDEKTFGTSFKDQANSIVAGRDGGYVVAGLKNREFITDGSLWFFKISENLDQGWMHEIPGDVGAYASEIRASHDCGYVLAGEKDDKIFLVKTDANGN